MIENFLDKHNVNIGKASGIILFIYMLEEIVTMIQSFIVETGFEINFGIIILYFLAKGMYYHNNLARKWIVWITGIGWIIVSYLCATMSDLPSIKSDTLVTEKYIEINNIRINDPSSFQIIVIWTMISMLCYLIIHILTCKKALTEFEEKTKV